MTIWKLPETQKQLKPNTLDSRLRGNDGISLPLQHGFVEAVFLSGCFLDAKKSAVSDVAERAAVCPVTVAAAVFGRQVQGRHRRGKGESGGFVFEGELDVGFGGFRGFFQAQLDLLLLAQEVAPVAFFIPVAPVQLDGVLDALAAVAALQIVFAAIFVAPPADALGVFGEYGEFFRHDMCLVFYWMKL